MFCYYYGFWYIACWLYLQTVSIINEAGSVITIHYKSLCLQMQFYNMLLINYKYMFICELLENLSFSLEAQCLMSSKCAVHKLLVSELK